MAGNMYIYDYVYVYSTAYFYYSIQFDDNCVADRYMFTEPSRYDGYNA